MAMNFKPQVKNLSWSILALKVAHLRTGFLKGAQRVQEKPLSAPSSLRSVVRLRPAQSDDTLMLTVKQRGKQ